MFAKTRCQPNRRRFDVLEERLFRNLPASPSSRGIKNAYLRPDVKKERFKKERNCLCPFFGQIYDLLGGMPLAGKPVGVESVLYPIKAGIKAY